MEPTIIKKIIPSTDPRLKRIIEHDSRSLNFPFNTAGLEIIGVEHTRHIPVLDQGEIGSCTGNAGIGDIATTPLFENLFMPSPFTLDEKGAVQLYSEAEKVDGGAGYPPEDQGSSGLSIAKVLKSKKIISSYQHTFTLTDCLKALSKYPVIIGINWYEDMFNPDPDGRVHISGALAGGHEIEAFKVDVTNQRVWFWNSWDKWGIQGMFYLSWTDLSILLAQQGDVVVMLPGYLRLGCSGDGVKVIQTQLNAGLTIDGSFGQKTLSALLKFQSKHGLIVDGVVGPETQKVLNDSVILKTLVDALIQVESQGNDNAIGDKTLSEHAYGCLQIRQGVCDDVNAKFSTTYKSQDCLGNRQVSLDIYNKYWQVFISIITNEDRARAWNGGPGWKQIYFKTNKTPEELTYCKNLDIYWTKVKSYL